MTIDGSRQLAWRMFGRSDGHVKSTLQFESKNAGRKLAGDL
jgi:hypothetical protein